MVLPLLDHAALSMNNYFTFKSVFPRDTEQTMKIKENPGYICVSYFLKTLFNIVEGRFIKNFLYFGVCVV